MGDVRSAAAALVVGACALVLAACTTSAPSGTTPATAAPGTVTAAPSTMSQQVTFRTRDTAGATAQRPFHFAVFC